MHLKAISYQVLTREFTHILARAPHSVDRDWHSEANRAGPVAAEEGIEELVVGLKEGKE